ncbi:hypothetical protein O3P69_001730 [Scylla paramamosain]|uniref:Uncharacterized protein n=1 Tax=Scylla paramamosain TaxID=85552 RepID=A0AAW0V3E8_SCYPA
MFEGVSLSQRTRGRVSCHTFQRETNKQYDIFLLLYLFSNIAIRVLRTVNRSFSGAGVEDLQHSRVANQLLLLAFVHICTVAAEVKHLKGLAQEV